MEKKTQKRKSTYKENRFILIKAMLQEFAEVNITSAVSLWANKHETVVLNQNSNDDYLEKNPWETLPGGPVLLWRMMDAVN